MHLNFLAPGSSAVLYSTRTEHGGAGHPRPVILGKGCRVPRGMELGVAGGWGGRWSVGVGVGTGTRRMACCALHLLCQVVE